MKRYGDIVNKQFRVNKKRNLSTVLGIVLSIILFTTVGFIQAYYKDINILEARDRVGSYEAIFKDIPKEDVFTLRNNVFINKLGLYSELWRSTISKDKIKKHINLHAMDNISLETMFSSLIELSEGRFPSNDTEVILDYIGKDYFEKKIGDIITLNNKEYKIVGFFNKSNSMKPHEIDMITYLDDKNYFENINAVFTVKPNKNKIRIIENIAKNLGIANGNLENESKVILNQVILYYYGYYGEGYRNIKNNDLQIQFILYGIILILTVFLTYSSINVCIKERREQFSILRCIGATKNKIRMLLVKESIFLAIFSLIPGIILGQIICYFISNVVFKKIVGINTYGLYYKIYFHVIGTVIVFTVLNIALATVIPVMKIGGISPIEGVTRGGEIQNHIKKRKSKLIKKLFGYDGELAYKNIRANNRNFIITTVTSVIILSTFIVFTGYRESVIGSYNISVENNKDISLDIPYKSNREYDDVFKVLNTYEKEIKKLGVTEGIYSKINYFTSGIFKGVTLNKKLEDRENKISIGEKNISIDGENGVYCDNINLVIVGDKFLQELIEIQNMDLSLEDFKENGVLLVDRKNFGNFMSTSRESLFNLKKGDKLILELNKYRRETLSGDLKRDIEKIKNNHEEINFKYLGSLNGKKIFDSNRYGIENYTTLIASRAFYEENKGIFINKNGENYLMPHSINLLLELNSHLNREKEVQILESYSNKIESYFLDNKRSDLILKNQVLISSSIVYIILFLTIIVGGINIINNKSISIRLRRKEIGTLLALGINKKRLRRILFLEGLVNWFISTITSIVISYVILAVMYKILSYNSDIIVSKMPILAMVIGVIILLAIDIIGVYLPLKGFKYTKTTEFIRNRK